MRDCDDSTPVNDVGGSPDVMFVYLPYGAVERPSIALGLLKQVVRDAGFTAEVLYANMDFAEKVGVHTYDAISRLSRELVGEWTFAGSAFPDLDPMSDEYMMALGRILKPSVAQGAAEEASAQLWPVRRAAENFIAETVERVLARNPKIVAVSSMFQQHCAALGFMRQIKETAPDVVTIIGGANCEGPMGQALWRNFPAVDYVVSGEADELISGLVQMALTHGADTPGSDLPEGVLGRRSTPGTKIGRARVTDLDATSVPDYYDYFDRLQHSALRAEVVPGLLVETSRGCWWGAIKHCTFCGLNGGSMSFRSKSPDRAVREFHELASRHNCQRFMVVDNIIDLGYFKSVLPKMTAIGAQDFDIFYETKANLRRTQVEQLRPSGVTWIQPGIESLHDDLLGLMAKGTTALINTRLLKWARAEGLFVSWNILYDIPLESDSAYFEIAKLIPALVHLQPPQAMLRIRVERFSPYQKTPELFGLSLEPAWAYRFVYPYDTAELMDLCYSFDAEGKERLQTNGEAIPTCQDRTAPGSGTEACYQAVSDWRKLYESASKPIFTIEARQADAVLFDTRPIATERLVHLSKVQTRLLEVCDEGASRAALTAQHPDIDDLDAVLNEMIARRWMVELSGKLLSLPVSGDVPSLPRRWHFPGGYVDTNRKENRETV